MKTILGFALVLVLHAAQTAGAADRDAEEIKALIPAATAMSLADFDRIASGSELPKPSSLKSQPLTLILLTLKPKADEAARSEFRFLGDGPSGAAKPAALAGEMTRFVRGSGRFRFATGPVTLLHADRITKHKCNVDGDSATGTVSFTVPKLIQGSVRYVAGRKDSKWRIEQFAIPAHETRIVLADDGTWKVK